MAGPAQKGSEGLRGSARGPERCFKEDARGWTLDVPRGGLCERFGQSQDDTGCRRATSGTVSAHGETSSHLGLQPLGC